MFKTGLLLPILVWIFCLKVPLWAQQNDVLERWFDLIHDDPTLAEILTELHENPVPVNQADRQQWQRIPLITQQEIDSILSYRQRRGAFTSIRQLQKIVGREKYRLIRPFVILRPVKREKTILTQRNYWSVETPQEILTGKFNGSKLYNLTRFQYLKKEQWAMGLVLQKDVGESSFNDYWNAFAAYYSKHWQLFLGSYYLQFGQGLLFASPFGRVKTSLVMLPFQSGLNKVSSYQGTAENWAQTGLCFKGQMHRNLQIILFGARNLRDGRFNPETRRIIGFEFSGYHRSTTERARQDIIQENVFGLQVTHRLKPGVQAQWTLVQFHYRPGIERNEWNVKSSELRKKFYDFNGDDLLLSSLAYDVQKRDWHLSGEIAGGRHSAPAWTQSCWLQKEPLRTGLIFWNLAPGFHSPYGRVLGQSDPFPGAIRGLYGALSWQKGNWEFNFYKILSQDLWRTYQSPFPQLKDEWLAQLRWMFGEHDLTLRWREKVTGFSGQEPGSGFQQADEIRIQYATQLQNRIEFRTRLESRHLKHSGQKGLLTFQQIRWVVSRRLRLYFRVTFFRTDAYDSRIYEYEQDVPGSFANYPLYGQGFKWYGLIQWQPFNGLKIWLKYRYLFIKDNALADVDYGRNVSALKRLLHLQIRATF